MCPLTAPMAVWLSIISMCLIMMVGIPAAFADGCHDLDSNENWIRGFDNLSTAYKGQDWKTALRYSKDLEEICADSPLLNYTIAQIHKNMGNDEKYLYYLQKASQNTGRFEVDSDMLERIWNEHYIALNPDAAPEKIEIRQKEILTLDAENEALKAALDSNRQSTDALMLQQAELQKERSTNEALLWTSVGVGAAGLIMTAVGATLLVKNNNHAIDANKEGYYVKSIYNTGWILVGSGAAITVIGATAAAFFGYRFNQFRMNDSTIDFSLNLSPAHTSLEVRF